MAQKHLQHGALHQVERQLASLSGRRKVSDSGLLSCLRSSRREWPVALHSEEHDYSLPHILNDLQHLHHVCLLHSLMQDVLLEAALSLKLWRENDAEMHKRGQDKPFMEIEMPMVCLFTLMTLVQSS